MQPYLKSKDISKSRKILLFKLRNRMVQVDGNYGKKNNSSKICLAGPDDQNHLTECVFLSLKCPEIQMIDYNDIYSNDIEGGIKWQIIIMMK